MNNLEKLHSQLNTFIRDKAYSLISKPATQKQLDQHMSQTEIMKQNILNLPFVDLGQLDDFNIRLNATYDDPKTFAINYPSINKALSADVNIVAWLWSNILMQNEKPYDYNNLLFDMLTDLENECTRQLAE